MDNLNAPLEHVRMALIWAAFKFLNKKKATHNVESDTDKEDNDTNRIIQGSLKVIMSSGGLKEIYKHYKRSFLSSHDSVAEIKAIRLKIEAYKDSFPKEGLKNLYKSYPQFADEAS